MILCLTFSFGKILLADFKIEFSRQCCAAGMRDNSNKRRNDAGKTQEVQGQDG
ncbi:MAG: hypothetical protein WC556_02405 [Candidatus Methanoperedens sp.]